MNINMYIGSSRLYLHKRKYMSGKKEHYPRYNDTNNFLIQCIHTNLMLAVESILNFPFVAYSSN